MLTMKHFETVIDGDKYRGVIESEGGEQRITLWCRWSRLLNAFVILPLPDPDDAALLIDTATRSNP